MSVITAFNSTIQVWIPYPLPSSFQVHSSHEDSVHITRVVFAPSFQDCPKIQKTEHLNRRRSNLMIFYYRTEERSKDSREAIPEFSFFHLKYVKAPCFNVHYVTEPLTSTSSLRREHINTLMYCYQSLWSQNINILAQIKSCLLLNKAAKKHATNFNISWDTWERQEQLCYGDGEHSILMLKICTDMRGRSPPFCCCCCCF